MIVIKFFRMAPFFAKSGDIYLLKFNKILGMSVTGSRSVGGFCSRGMQFCRKWAYFQKVAIKFHQNLGFYDCGIYCPAFLNLTKIAPVQFLISTTVHSIIKSEKKIGARFHFYKCPRHYKLESWIFKKIFEGKKPITVSPTTVKTHAPGTDIWMHIPMF